VLSSAPIALWIFGGLEAVMLAAFITSAITVFLPVFQRNDHTIARSPLRETADWSAYLTRPGCVDCRG
jgi:hypothetical protein